MSEVQIEHFFKVARARASAWLRPGKGEAVDISDIAASPDGNWAVATATVCAQLENTPATRIALIDLRSGVLNIITSGSGTDRLPKWSPDGTTLGYLSDHGRPGLPALRLLDMASRQDRGTAMPDGIVEHFHWSADGMSVLLAVAGYGADVAGAQGGVGRSTVLDSQPSWSPKIEKAPEAEAWRSAWVTSLATDTTRKVSPDGINIWEVVWCGPRKIAAICSNAPGESDWYTADVRLIGMHGGAAEVLFKPLHQIGWLSASPSGATLVVVEAICSDRTIVAGDMKLVDCATGAVSSAPSLDADVVQTIWRGEDHILFAASHGRATIIGVFEKRLGNAREIWRDTELTVSGARFPEIAALGDAPGDALFGLEGFFVPQKLAALHGGIVHDIRQFLPHPPDGAESITALGQARSISWRAPDGLVIEGWLLTPDGPGPHPLVMEIHGGPVWYFRPQFIGRNVLLQMLLAEGYAIFQPNPRGSSGRGQDFAGRIFGEMGGADTGDYFSGLDALAAQGIADPARIGVMGRSYGGFMSAWLITQDKNRFAAAIPLSPVTNWVSEYLTCHIPSFCERFLDDQFDHSGGRFFSFSPVFFTRDVHTPTLNVCGALDKNTPPGQAMEFHNALLLAGCESVLVTYPQEGHGVRKMPAIFDFAARTLDWFQTHMPADAGKPAA